MDTTHTKGTVVFGSGCFWCTEAVFRMFQGVLSVTVGYAGGATKKPTYEEVSEGTTGHAEVVRLEFDPTILSFKKVLTIFFGSHDATTKNRQGYDVGTQYRSAVFYTTPAQKSEAEEYIADLNKTNTGAPIVTEVLPLDTFYEAEAYHAQYYEKNKTAQYCAMVIQPKLEKVQKEFAELLKEEELKKKLTPEQYHVLREKGTEAPFSGVLRESPEGIYACAVCGNTLFSADAKFDSGTGWPSFDSALEGSVRLVADTSLGSIRTEVLCARCGSHLGHVFEDGPTQTGKRYCVNAVCLEPIHHSPQ